MNASARHPAWKWWVCGLLFLATMINYMDRLTLNLTAKRIKDTLLLSNEQYGQVESFFGVAFALGALIFGWIVDRWNARWVYAAALFAWSAAGFATGFVQTFTGLLVCRFLLGLFEAGNWPCALRTTQRILPPRHRTMGNSILQSGAAVGAVITPLIVQFMITGAGQEWLSDVMPGDPVRPESVALVACAPEATFPANIPWGALFLGQQDRNWRYPFLVVGVIGTVWVFLWLAVVRRSDLALPEPPVRAPTLASEERDAGRTESFFRIYFDPRFAVLVTVVVSINLTWHFFRVWLPLFLRVKHHYTEEDVSYFMAGYYAATDAGSLAAGFGTLYLARHGATVHRSRVLVFFVCSLLTMLAVVVSRLPLETGMVLPVLLLIIGFGALGLFPVYYSLSQELTVRHQGKLTGTLGCITWLASAAMHPVVGKRIDQTGDYGLAMACAGVFPMLGYIALVSLWKQPTPSEPV